jgi:hypothetical protein
MYVHTLVAYLRLLFSQVSQERFLNRNVDSRKKIGRLSFYLTFNPSRVTRVEEFSPLGQVF